MPVLLHFSLSDPSSLIRDWLSLGGVRPSSLDPPLLSTPTSLDLIPGPFVILTFKFADSPIPYGTSPFYAADPTFNARNICPRLFPGSTATYLIFINIHVIISDKAVPLAFMELPCNSLSSQTIAIRKKHPKKNQGYAMPGNIFKFNQKI